MNKEQMTMMLKFLDSLQKFLADFPTTRAGSLSCDAANLQTAIMYDHTNHEHQHTEDKSIATLHLDRELMIMALHLAANSLMDNPDNKPKQRAWRKAAQLLKDGWVLKVTQ